MEYQTIKGEKVPSLGLGTYRLTGEECARAVKRALTLGYRHIDTAQMYRNDEEVGRGMRNSGVDREDAFLVTKVWPSDFSHDNVVRKTRESLKKLGTNYMDLLLMHWPSQGVPLEETLGAMSELKIEGSVRHVGVSNFPPSVVEEAAGYAEVFCNQVEYHPYKAQDELLKHKLLGEVYHLTVTNVEKNGRTFAEVTSINKIRTRNKDQQATEQVPSAHEKVAT